LDGGVAEQSDVAGLGAADGRFRFRQDQLAARALAGFHLDPRFLENYLRQADQQAYASAQNDETQRAGTPQLGVFALASKQVGPGAFKQLVQHAAQHAAGSTANQAVQELASGPAPVAPEKRTGQVIVSANGCAD